MLNDFLSLIYPRNCVACGTTLNKHEEHLCNYCYTHLPKTHFHNLKENPIEKLFYGRISLVFASSFYMYTKKGCIQKVLHSIKYQNNKELAGLIGKWYGDELKENSIITLADYIIPVPLHPKKFKQRGFNQSEEFAKSLSDSLAIPILTSCLIRNTYTVTQTRKNKYARWENVEDVFEIINGLGLKNKHIILVDDVITTGATIEACAKAFQGIEGIQLSVLSIAYAQPYL